MLQEDAGPTGRVQDVRLRLTVVQRRSRVLYLPAYALRYVFGITLNDAGERREQEFEALIGAAGTVFIRAVLVVMDFFAHSSSLLLFS